MINNKKSESVIKILDKKASKGNFYSAYQLYKYYSKGTYVKKSSKKADEYLMTAFNIFKEQKLRITHLELENFRGIHDLEININDKNLTVILGINGVGKTTILDAIALNISWLRNSIINIDGNGDFISSDDISLENQSNYSSISTRFNLNKSLNANLEVVAVSEGFDINKKSYLKEIKKIGKMYKEANKIDPYFNLPLLAYYTVDRSLDINAKDVVSFDETTIFKKHEKFAGYQNSLNGVSDFKLFFRWYKRISDIANYRESKKPKTPYAELLHSLPEDIDGSIKKVLLGLISEEDKDKDKEKGESLDDAINSKRILNKLVASFMDGYGNIEIQLEPRLALTIEKKGKKLNVLQLSQGEKSLLALVLDIGRRLIILNPGLENPLDGDGIILIDEIDLHLHPVWQRDIIRRLTNSFKNCQFIVATHSAQIIGEVKHSQVVVLHQETDHTVNCFQPPQTYGLTSNEVLSEVMSFDYPDLMLNRNSDVEDKLKEINELLSENLFEEAKSRISKLEIELNGEIPDLLSAKLDIELSDWKD